MAVNGQNAIELYGPQDDLTEVTSTAILGNSSGDFSGNLTALVYVVGLGSVVDRAGNDWLAASLKEISTDWNNGQDTVKLSTTINDKKYELSGEQSSEFNIVSLIIYSAKDSNPPTQ